MRLYLSSNYGFLRADLSSPIAIVCRDDIWVFWNIMFSNANLSFACTAGRGAGRKSKRAERKKKHISGRLTTNTGKSWQNDARTFAFRRRSSHPQTALCRCKAHPGNAPRSRPYCELCLSSRFTPHFLHHKEMQRGGRYHNRGSSYGARGGRNNRKATQPRGLFADGIWHCNCIPRLPAEHFKVKKEGPNTGRWFYTCQKDQEKRCDFFLWDEDAKPREESAVLNNSRTEPERGNADAQDGWNAGRRGVRGEEQQQGKGFFAGNQRNARDRDDASTQSPSPPPSYSSVPRMNGSKRSAKEANLDVDEEFGCALGEDDAEEMAKTADAHAFSTPHKAQKTGIYATPATTGKRKLPWLEQPTTPAIPSANGNGSEEYFTTPSKLPANKSVHFSPYKDEPETPAAPPTLATANRTPSPPTRHKDALANPADSTSSLTHEVMTCLKPSSASIPPDTLSTVRSILTRHDLKTQGVMRGRDMSRLAIKAKDAKIAELQARIASLEADMEVERGVNRMKRWERESAQG